eukprot:TRINITY_DN3928_c0_g3_i2.p1 TRINITY_DN3928_c0_g3~~TRINITY_DN3928_c0_g3_i2.p1  ORF type:complete len:374 (-),score=101.34 TRINITY_DN3928_c0_g3_i2:125-1246(-)
MAYDSAIKVINEKRKYFTELLKQTVTDERKRIDSAKLKLHKKLEKLNESVKELKEVEKRFKEISYEELHNILVHKNSELKEIASAPARALPDIVHACFKDTLKLTDLGSIQYFKASELKDKSVKYERKAKGRDEVVIQSSGQISKRQEERQRALQLQGAKGKKGGLNISECKSSKVKIGQKNARMQGAAQASDFLTPKIVKEGGEAGASYGTSTSALVIAVVKKTEKENIKKESRSFNMKLYSSREKLDGEVSAHTITFNNAKPAKRESNKEDCRSFVNTVELKDKLRTREFNVDNPVYTTNLNSTSILNNKAEEKGRLKGSNKSSLRSISTLRRQTHVSKHNMLGNKSSKTILQQRLLKSHSRDKTLNYHHV